jgi:hypothetical protein
VTAPESAVTFGTLWEQRPASGLEFPAVRALAAVRDRWWCPGDLQNAYLVAPGGQFLLATDTQGLGEGRNQRWVDAAALRGTADRKVSRDK